MPNPRSRASRETQEIYQKWADEVEDDSYTLDNILPYLKSSCRLTPSDVDKRWPANDSVLFDSKAFETRHPGPSQISWSNWAMSLDTWARKEIKSLEIYPSRIGFNSDACFQINLLSDKQSRNPASFSDVFFSYLLSGIVPDDMCSKWRR